MEEGQDISVSKEIRLDIIYTPVFAISLKGSDYMQEENPFSKEQMKHKLQFKEPSESQINYAYAIADVLELDKPIGDSYVFWKFINTNKPKYVAFFEKQKKENTIERFLRYRPVEIPLKNFKKQIEKLYKQSGVYAFLGKDNELLYIGKSIDLSNRIPSSLNERRRVAFVNAVLYYPVETEADTNILEIMLIAENKPILNGESNSKDYPIMYHSNINIIKDFERLDFDFEKYEKDWLKEHNTSRSPVNYSLP